MILSRKQVEVWKNSTIPIDGYGPLIRNLLDTIDDLMADRPAPSGEANLRHTPNCNSVLFNGPMAECDCGLIAPAPQMVEDFDRAERVFKSVGSGENVYEAFAAEFAIIRAAERNRARREALIEAAEIIANEIRLRENEHLGYDHLRPIDELEADIRALAADIQ